MSSGSQRTCCATRTARARPHQLPRSRAIEDFLGIDPLDPHRVAEGREDLGLVARTIDQLPEKTRRIFTLYRIEHIDKRTIADSFGLSVRMVEIHVQRALEALASSMEKSR